jgi:hypothetical protein
LKLSKKSGFILVAGIAIAIFAGLWLARDQQVQEQEQLREELSIATMRLQNSEDNEVLYSQLGELEEQLSQTISQLETAKAPLSHSGGSIDVSGNLFDIAEATSVEITEISLSQQQSDSLEGLNCSVRQLSVTVEGDVPDIISFVGSLNSDFKTGLVRLVDISIPETTCEEAVTANIQLDIYTYQG